ncbi:HAD family hydrolase [Saccharospirillum salsuginis]|uniref:Haloacid dehalogenase n=1 Tax=Saccharospirillum salsuginis TaxID=418750 RepID=A0A918KKB4_9GAMM|nr:HAD family phosphatase [Saccharospirillum salsuginis]GGX64249.1 haloacid dehalogenase [Saccharospirillum salsuginis]
MTVLTDRPYLGVLWDMDGVLIDSERLVRAVFVDVMTGGGPVPDPEQRYLETIGLNRTGLIQWFLQFVPDETTAEFWIDQTRDGFNARAKTELELKPGVIDALNHVRDAGLRQMVVTSTRTTMAEDKLARVGLLDYFTEVLGGDQVAQGKPHPEPYQKGCERLGLQSHQALAIEDSPNGVRSALAAGCAVIHVPDLIETDPDWHADLAGALDSLADLPRWMTQQEGGHWL